MHYAIMNQIMNIQYNLRQILKKTLFLDCDLHYCYFDMLNNMPGSLQVAFSLIRSLR